MANLTTPIPRSQIGTSPFICQSERKLESGWVAATAHNFDGSAAWRRKKANFLQMCVVKFYDYVYTLSFPVLFWNV
jgi:hypothetical protein